MWSGYWSWHYRSFVIAPPLLSVDLLCEIMLGGFFFPLLMPHTQALSSLAGHWKMSVLSRNPHRLLLILIVCFSFNFPFFASKPAALPTRKRGSKVFDSNSRQTLRGTSSARQPLMFHAEPDREEREKLLKLYLKRSITLSVMTLTV